MSSAWLPHVRYSTSKRINNPPRKRPVMVEFADFIMSDDEESFSFYHCRPSSGVRYSSTSRQKFYTSYVVDALNDRCRDPNIKHSPPRYRDTNNKAIRSGHKDQGQKFHSSEGNEAPGQYRVQQEENALPKKKRRNPDEFGDGGEWWYHHELNRRLGEHRQALFQRSVYDIPRSLEDIDLDLAMCNSNIAKVEAMKSRSQDQEKYRPEVMFEQEWCFCDERSALPKSCRRP